MRQKRTNKRERFVIGTKDEQQKRVRRSKRNRETHLRGLWQSVQKVSGTKGTHCLSLRRKGTEAMQE